MGKQQPKNTKDSSQARHNKTRQHLSFVSKKTNIDENNKAMIVFN